jgi:hypothetical protein
MLARDLRQHRAPVADQRARRLAAGCRRTQARSRNATPRSEEDSSVTARTRVRRARWASGSPAGWPPAEAEGGADRRRGLERGRARVRLDGQHDAVRSALCRTSAEVRSDATPAPRAGPWAAAPEARRGTHPACSAASSVVSVAHVEAAWRSPGQVSRSSCAGQLGHRRSAARHALAPGASPARSRSAGARRRPDIVRALVALVRLAAACGRHLLEPGGHVGPSSGGTRAVRCWR